MVEIRGCKVHWSRSWQRVRDRIARSCDKTREKAAFSLIASQISELEGGENVADCFKTLFGESQATSLVGIVKGLTTEEARFVDNECDWSRAHHWALWWMRPTHLRMLIRTFHPCLKKYGKDAQAIPMLWREKNGTAKIVYLLQSGLGLGLRLGSGLGSSLPGYGKYVTDSNIS